MEGEAIIQQARTAGASYAELRWESAEESRIQREDGEVRSVVAGTEQGFCLRVIAHGAWGMATSNRLDAPSARDAVTRAIQLAKAAAGRGDEAVRLADAPALRKEEVWKPKVDPRGVDVQDKLRLLAEVEAAVRTFPEIASTTTSAADVTIRKRLWTTDGADLRWGLTRTIVAANYTARRGSELSERGTRLGGTGGWEIVTGGDPVAKARRHAESAVKALGAPSPKGGRTTVVIDHELAGVFAHEAVGHAAEADLVVAGESCFRGKLGKRIGREGLHIHDDSTVPGGFGSFPFDDHGVAGERRPIIEDGVLTGFLTDREHAARLGIRPNGSARAQSFEHRPLVRMSNTLISAGDVPEGEVFGDVKDGVYCKGSRGGQVDCARGTFLFNAQEAYRIRDGEVAEPLRDVSLTGDILQTLFSIDALGNRARLGDPGHCGKGQWVPVCDGGPLVRMRDCLVGGSG